MVTMLVAAAIALPPFGDVKVVDEIDCSKFGVKAKYYALVHTGRQEKSDIKVKIPDVRGEVEFVAYGKTKPLKDGVLEFKTLKPLQLIAIKAK